MKKILYFLFFSGLLVASCDKVENPYPNLPSSDLDWSLYPGGDSATYASNGLWPSFAANTNTNRNVLIEDFTGHLCFNCPAASYEAEQIADANPGRVYVVANHTGPQIYDPNWNGNPPSGFNQVYTSGLYKHNFCFDEGLQIGSYFGAEWPSSNFFANPSGMVSRKAQNGQPASAYTEWSNKASTILTANELKVNLQSASNYFPSTRGYFLHVEVDILDNTLTPDDLAVVTFLVEDSIVRPQYFPGGVDSVNYVHHDVLRDCLDGRFKGRDLSDAREENGKYYLDYTYKLPDEPQYNTDNHSFEANNMHVLIFVRDKNTEEVYHIIKEKIE